MRTEDCPGLSLQELTYWLATWRKSLQRRSERAARDRRTRAEEGDRGGDTLVPWESKVHQGGRGRRGLARVPGLMIQSSVGTHAKGRGTHRNGLKGKFQRKNPEHVFVVWLEIAVSGALRNNELRTTELGFVHDKSLP